MRIAGGYHHFTNPVSTSVGGIPEVLPRDLIVFAQPNAECLIDGIKIAIERMYSGSWNPQNAHKRVAKMYNWDDIAERTGAVYSHVMDLPSLSASERFIRFYKCGQFAGKFAVMIVAFNYILYFLLDCLFPRRLIDAAPTFDHTIFRSMLIAAPASKDGCIMDSSDEN